jgi:hypothetical protein
MPLLCVSVPLCEIAVRDARTYIRSMPISVAASRSYYYAGLHLGRPAIVARG